MIEGAALAQFAEELAAAAERPEPRPVVSESARNRFVGLVTRVLRDTVMAQVDIQAGPHRFVSLMSREAADELGLEPGVLAIAAVKATNVVVEVPCAVKTPIEGRLDESPYAAVPGRHRRAGGLAVMPLAACGSSGGSSASLGRQSSTRASRARSPCSPPRR